MYPTQQNIVSDFKDPNEIHPYGYTFHIIFSNVMRNVKLHFHGGILFRFSGFSVCQIKFVHMFYTLHTVGNVNGLC